MAKNIIIPLATPISDGDSEITRVELREPRAREYFDLGDPVSFAKAPDGTIYYTTDESVVKKYVERLCVVPESKILVMNVTLADSMRIKDALLDFFNVSRGKAAKADDPSPISPPTSSSSD